MEFIMLPIILGLYFLPAIIGRKKKNSGALGIANLFLGWTGIGWVGCLIWGAMRD